MRQRSNKQPHRPFAFLVLEFWLKYKMHTIKCEKHTDLKSTLQWFCYICTYSYNNHPDQDIHIFDLQLGYMYANRWPNFFISWWVDAPKSCVLQGSTVEHFWQVFTLNPVLLLIIPFFNINSGPGIRLSVLCSCYHLILYNKLQLSTQFYRERNWSFENFNALLKVTQRSRYSMALEPRPARLQGPRAHPLP